MCDYSTSVGHQVEGPQICETVIPVKRQNHLNSDKTRKQVVDRITSKVIELTQEKGIHPGDVAITYDDYDFNQIFEGYDIYGALDECAKGVLQKQTPLSSFKTEESVLFPHQRALTSCECKYYIGPYKELKGLTVKVVIYISIQGRTRGHNRLAAYTSLTRSSCAIEMFYVQVKNMKMDNYQMKKYDNDKSSKRGIGNLSVTSDDDGLTKHVWTYVGKTSLTTPHPVAFDFPSAIGSSSGFKSTTQTIGTMTYLKKPKNVESEWLEDCLIPKSCYSHPIPGGGSFVQGFQEYSIPTDPRRKKEPTRRAPDYLAQDIELRRRTQLARQEQRRKIEQNEQ